MNVERHPLLRHLRPALPPPPWPRQRPQVSFIVCTRDRLAVLEACIESIRAACRAHPAYTAELVVVDNGS
ncbi:glycosyltransferase, partial [Mesorhizobium sp.]